MNWRKAAKLANARATAETVYRMNLWANSEAAAMQRVSRRSHDSALVRVADVHAVVLGHPTELLRALSLRSQT